MSQQSLITLITRITKMNLWRGQFLQRNGIPLRIVIWLHLQPSQSKVPSDRGQTLTLRDVSTLTAQNVIIKTRVLELKNIKKIGQWVICNPMQCTNHRKLCPPSGTISGPFDTGGASLLLYNTTLLFNRCKFLGVTSIEFKHNQITNEPSTKIIT